MGRTTDVLRKGFRAAKCLTLLKLATSRIKVVRNKRSISAKQMRGEIAQLIKSGQDAHVYIAKADALIKQENMVAVYDILDQYCHAIMSRFPAIELQRSCPADMKEPIASIIYATPRCVELTELVAIKDAFVAKYGKDFAAAASELRPNCGVNTQVIELLSIRPATGDMKIKLMKDICKEHNVDWTPGETLAGPAVVTGHTEAKLEPMQATGTLGSIKANAVGVGEAGPSKIMPPQGGSKHGAKSGLAEAVVSATTASKFSVQKQSSSLEGAKGKTSFSESFKGVVSTESSKSAVLAADDLKVNDTKQSTYEEEDARRLHARILQSLKGGSFADSEVEAEANVEDLKNPVDADGQVALSDSDSDSFVSVEEGRFEDDGESSSHGAASRKESFRDNPIQGFTEGDWILPSSSKKLSTSSQQDVYTRASSKNSRAAIEIHEGMSASSNFDSLPSEISHEDIPLKVNSQKAFDAETILKKERREESFNRGKLAQAQSVKLKENMMMDESKDNFFRVTSRKGSSAEETMEGKGRKDSLNMGKLVDSESVPETLNSEAILKKESREDSFSRGKFNEAQSVGLKENMMMDESKDNFSRVSSRKSSSAEEMMEEKGRKDCLNMGNLVDTQSVEELNEHKNMNEKKAEELSIKTSDQEGLQEKDCLENKFAEATTKSSVEWKLSEIDRAEARKTPEGLDDERCLHSDGVIEDMPSMETTEIEVVRNEECVLDANEVQFVAEEKPKLPASEMFKDQSVSKRGVDEEISPAVHEEAYWSNEELSGRVPDDASRVFGRESHPSFENVLETGGGELGSLPAGKSAEQLFATPSVAALENGQDFAAAAKAIAAEAARLAVLDYAKRLAGSGSIPLDLSELSKLGISFEESKREPQPTKNHRIEGTSEYNASEAFGYARDGKSYETDAIEEEKIFKIETSLNHEKGRSSDYLEVNEMLENNEKFKSSVVDDAPDVERDVLNTSTISFENEGRVTEIEDVNPFAASVATTTDKDINSPLSEIDSEKARWVDMMQPGQTSKGGNVGSEDHLDIFFRRKMHQLPGQYPMYDEERYGYSKITPSVKGGSMSYDGFDMKKSSLQENLFSKPLFNTGAEGQSAVFKESSNSLKRPAFDEADGGSFKSPVFDEVPEPSDIVFSSDDGVDKNEVYSVGADMRGARSPITTKRTTIFDPEPEPCFDSVADAEELYTYKRKESPPKGQLKWQSKKPLSTAEHKITGNEPMLNMSDLSPRASGNPLSRRSRRQPQASDDQKHYGDSTSQLGSRNRLLQQEENDPERKGEWNVGEKNSLRREQVRPHVSSSSARSQQSSYPSKRVTSQGDYDSPLEDDWESTSTKISSTSPTKSRTSLDNRQRVRPENYYFPENDDLAGGSAGTFMSRTTHKSPTRMTKQKLYVGVEEDLVAYKGSYNMAKTPKLHQHDMVEDERIEDLERKYKASLQANDLSNKTSADSGVESHLQLRHQPQRPGLRSEYEQYEEDEGESSRTRPLSNRLQPKKYMEEEEHYLVSRYKPMVQDDGPFDNARSNKSRLPYLSRPQKDVDEDSEQQRLRQEEPGMDFNVNESLRTRPMSSRLHQKKKPIEEEKPSLVSRYKPIVQDDEPSDYGSSNRKRVSNLYQLDEDFFEDKEQLRPDSRQYKGNVDESVGTRPKSSRSQLKTYSEEESYLMSKYTRRNQDADSLDSGSSNSSRVPKLYQSQSYEDLHVGDRLQTQTDDLIERASASLGGNRWNQQSRQEEEDGLESGYAQHKEVSVGGDRILRSPSFTGQRPSDFEEAQDLASGYKPLEQSDSQVKTSSVRLLSSSQQEKKRFEEVESESVVKYNTPFAIEDRFLGCQGEDEHQVFPQMPSQQKQRPQRKQNWPTESDGFERDSQSKMQSPGSQQVEQLRKDKQQSTSGRQQKPSMAEEAGEKQHLPSPSYKNQQKEENSLYESGQLQEEKQEQVQQVSKLSQLPLYSRKQDIRLEDNASISDQQKLERQVGGPSTHKEMQPQEEGVDKQQEKTHPEAKPLARRHQSQTEEEGTTGKQDKSDTKSHISSQQPSQSISLPLESSISDPIVLATIPPPVKKPSTLSPTKLETSSSAPSASKPPEVKAPKLPQKPPKLEDLAANFEAFRRARKGE